jgi:hypothetical protein
LQLEDIAAIRGDAFLAIPDNCDQYVEMPKQTAQSVAKVGVESSNLFARSNFPQQTN